MSADLEALQKAAAKDPSFLVKLADSLVAAGRAEDAVRACREALAARSDDVPLRLALSRALSAAGHLEEAGAAMMDAAARDRRQKAAAGPPVPPPKPKPAREPTQEVIEDDVFDEEPTRQSTRREMVAELPPEPAKPRKATIAYADARPRSLGDESNGDTDKVTSAYGPEYTDLLRRESTFRENPVQDTAPHGAVDLEAVAAALMGQGAVERRGDGVGPRRRGSCAAGRRDGARLGCAARAQLRVVVDLAGAGGRRVGGGLPVQRGAEEKGARGAGHAGRRPRHRGHLRVRARRARPVARAVRLDPRTRRYFALDSLGNARLTADHGDDTDATAWAMMKRAEREQKRHPEPPGSDPRVDHDQRVARALLALSRGETCTPTEDGDGDVAARCALQRGDVDAARRILGLEIQQAGAGKGAIRPLLVLASLELGAGDLDAADKAYTEVLGRSSGHPRALVGKALVALERGETPNVTPPPGRLGPTTEAWFHLAAGLAEMGRANGDEQAASAELDLVRKGIVHDGRLALHYGRSRLMQGKVYEAE